MPRNTATKNLAHALTVWQASNLRQRLDSATPAEWQEGQEWYADAHAYAVQLSKRYDHVSLSQAAGIIAALSPQVSWDLNKRLAVELIETRTAAGALGLGIGRALDI